MTRALLIILALFTPLQTPADDPLREWAVFARGNGARQLTAWMRCVALGKLTGAECERAVPAGLPLYHGKLGLFVTFIKGAKVRGCYGAFHHKSDDASLTLKEYVAGALYADPRHTPPDIAELEDTTIVLTVADEPVSVDDINRVDFSRYGLMIYFETGERLVLVPSEIRNRDRLETILRSGTVAQCAAFRAVTIR
jgi:AMMECR1 domain-containing protein